MHASAASTSSWSRAEAEAHSVAAVVGMRRAEAEEVAVGCTIAERRDEVASRQSFQAQRREMLQKMRHQGGGVRVHMRDGDAACGHPGKYGAHTVHAHGVEGRSEEVRSPG